jgi:hypothetical protein
MGGIFLSEFASVLLHIKPFVCDSRILPEVYVSLPKLNVSLVQCSISSLASTTYTTGSRVTFSFNHFSLRWASVMAYTIVNTTDSVVLIHLELGNSL